MKSILVLDDERNIRTSLRDIMEDEGYRVYPAETGREGLEILEDNLIDIVLLDVKLPDIDGIQVLEHILKDDNPPEVIMISGHSNIEIAVKATKLGAFDFLEKPFDLDQLIISVSNALDKLKLKRKTRNLLEESGFLSEIIGESRAIKEILGDIKKSGPSEGTVLISGDSGVGKELIAKAIHYSSHRSSGPFILVNCAAIPDDLIEAELFGFEKGAFTGALKKKRGKFELADGGTIFLDEIGDMSLKTQAKVLRVLQDGNFSRIGSEEKLNSDIRVIAATNKDLKHEIRNNRFREDLFYRLNVIPINIPPLKNRPEDIRPLVRYFTGYFAIKNKKNAPEFDDDAMDILMNYPWPGNVRELKNIIERIIIMNDRPVIAAENIPTELRTEIVSRQDKKHRLSLKEQKDRFEKETIKRALILNNWNISRTARHLKMERSLLHKKIKKYNISK